MDEVFDTTDAFWAARSMESSRVRRLTCGLLEYAHIMHTCMPDFEDGEESNTYNSLLFLLQL